jgi:ElaB/YqjD/DUF883 family membrane-anchored ribosome-binding protein
VDQQTAELSNKTPEEIEREMLQTRESITQKVAALETQVIGTAQSVTTAVSDTVESVKSLISSAPEKAKEAVAAVREQFDVTGCIRRNPAASLGTSAAVGFLVGYLLGGRSAATVPAAAAYQPAYTPPEPRREPGVFDELINMVGREAKRLAQDAIAATSAALKDNIHSGVPKLVDAAVSRVQPEPAV